MIHMTLPFPRQPLQLFQALWRSRQIRMIAIFAPSVSYAKASLNSSRMNTAPIFISLPANEFEEVGRIDPPQFLAGLSDSGDLRRRTHRPLETSKSLNGG
jgi:hypothetical protein